MLKHLLVPLDGSALAERALATAQHILPPGGRITLVSAIPNPTPPIYAYPSIDVVHEITQDLTHAEEATAQARDYLSRIAEQLQAAGYAVATEIIIGEPAYTIVDVASQHQAELIVMSTHGRSGINRLIFGSVTMKVLSEAPCPVLVVPSREAESA